MRGSLRSAHEHSATSIGALKEHSGALEAQSTAIKGTIEAFTSLPPLTKCRIRRIDEQEYIATTAPPEHTPMDSNLEGSTCGEEEGRDMGAVVSTCMHPEAHGLES